MATPRIVLHQWSISPFCGKVRKVLAFKRLPFEVVEYAGLRALGVRKVSRPGKLPVLDYGERRIQDSSAIVRLLEVEHPTPTLLPDAPHERALALVLEDWADESLYWFEMYLRIRDPIALARTAELLCVGRPAYERFLTARAFRRYGRHLDAQGLGRQPLDRVKELLADHLAQIEVMLARDGWMVGAQPSIADLAAAAQLDEIVRTSTHRDVITSRPRIVEWLARCDTEAARG